MTPPEPSPELRDLKIRAAREAGLINAHIAWEQSRGLIPYWAACAFLMQESGGRNVWGSDATWMVGYGDVTECAYQVYREHRARFGMQGVGPMQLTWWVFQDRATARGGCWMTSINMRVGFEVVRQLLDDGDGDWWWAAKAYNGSDLYADQMMERFEQWKAIIPN